MPGFVAAAVAAAWSSVAAAVASVTIGSVLTSLATGLIVSAASNALLSRREKSAPTSDIKDPGAHVTARQAVAPHRIIYGQARVGGVIAFISLDTFSGATSNALNMVVVLAGHPCEDITAVYFDDVLLQLDATGKEVGYYSNEKGDSFVQVNKHLGHSAEWDGWLGTVTPDLWDPTHLLQGRCWMYVRVLWDRDRFPTGLPNITAIVKGKRVYDPRSGTTYFSENAALCVADYLASDYGWGAAYGSEIDTTALIAAANICDETITIPAEWGGSEYRYTCNGTLSADMAPRQAIAALLTSMAGKAVYVGGTWRLIAGAYSAPTITLNEADVRGPIRIQSRLPKREICNRVRGLYVDKLKDWQPVDFPAVTNATYLAEDGNEEIWRDIELPFCTTYGNAAAQRMAKIEMERTRQQIVVTLPCKLSAYRVQAGDTVGLTLARMGWSNKAFEVISTQLAFESDGTVGVDLVLRETAASVYTWSAEETVRDPAPDTSLPDPFSMAPPYGLSAVSGDDQLVRGGDGTVLESILLSWSAPLLFARDYEVLTTPWSGSGWTYPLGPAAWSFNTSDSPARIFGVENGTTYKLSVRARSIFGVVSSWAEILHTVVGKTTPPADVTSLTINDRTLSWAPVQVADLAGYWLRYQSGRNISWGDAIPLHEGVIQAAPYTLAIRPAGQITLMIKAVDTSGNQSANPAVIVTDFGDALTDNIVLSYDFEALGWVGTLTGGAIGTGQIEADAPSAMWLDDGKAFWTADSVLMWLGSYSAMTYTDAITVGTAEAGARMTVAYTATGESIALYWRPMGQSAMWGTVATELFWIDDAAAMWQIPEFAPWPGEAIVPADTYELRIVTGGGTIQGIVSAFVAYLDVPDVVERFNDVSIAAGGTRLTLTQSYRIIRNVLLTLQDDGGSAATVKAIDKDATAGPLVQCFNTSGTGMTGLIDATIQGY